MVYVLYAGAVGKPAKRRRADSSQAKGKAEDLAKDAEGAWEKLKGKAGETGEAVKQELTDIGKR